MALTLQDDMDNIFLDAGFEETIIYTPSGGTAKSISAIVYRQGAKESSSNRRLSNAQNRTYDIEIDISTDVTNGIANVTTREDKVALKREIGDSTNTTFLVKGIIQDDEGAKRLGIG
uniref:Tail protein n=1 Tax=viral metagenome TaxID=1070528 RepID=A0A6M3LZJ6_9ZZZZ